MATSQGTKVSESGPPKSEQTSTKSSERVNPSRDNDDDNDRDDDDGNNAVRAAAHRGKTPVETPEGGTDRDAQKAVPSPFGTSVGVGEPVHAPFSTPNVISVIAIEKGHDGFTVREVGEVFEIDVNNPKYRGSTWFEPLDKSQTTKREPDSRGFRRTAADPRPPGQGPKPGSVARDPRDVD